MVGYFRHTAGQSDTFQIPAVVKHTLTNLLYTVRNNDLRHIALFIYAITRLKGILIDGGDGIGDGDRTALSLIVNQDPVYDHQIALTFLPWGILKRILADAFDTLGNHKVSETGCVVKRVCPNTGYGVRNDHAGQAFTGAERTVANACDAVREFHIAQILHIEECVISDAGHAFFDNDRCDLLEVYNVIDSPPRPGIAPWVISHFSASGDRLADDKRTVIVKRPGYIAADTVSHHFCAGRDPGRLSCRGRTVGGSFLRFGLLLDGRFYLILREIFRLLLSGHFCLIPRGFFRFFLSM